MVNKTPAGAETGLILLHVVDSRWRTTPARNSNAVLTKLIPRRFSNEELLSFIQNGIITDSHQSLRICVPARLSPGNSGKHYDIVLEKGRKQPIWSSGLISFRKTYILMTSVSDGGVILACTSLSGISGR